MNPAIANPTAVETSQDGAVVPEPLIGTEHVVAEAPQEFDTNGAVVIPAKQAPVEPDTVNPVTAAKPISTASKPTPQPKKATTHKPVLALYLTFAMFVLLTAAAYYAYTKTA